MSIIKKISVYKIINIFSLLVVCLSVVIYYKLLATPCPEIDASYDCLYDKKFAIYQPMYFGGKILAMILGGLLLFPPRIFKKWLFFVLPIPLYITYWLVQDISVYSGGVLYVTRAQTAENGMIVLAIITVVFVIGHLLYDWKKGKK